MTYKRSIKAFDKVSLVTRLIYWNERRFYLEHIFYVKDEIRAISYVEGLVRAPKGHLKPAEAFKSMGVTRELPVLPASLQGWIDLVYEPHKNK